MVKRPLAPADGYPPTVNKFTRQRHQDPHNHWQHLKHHHPQDPSLHSHPRSEKFHNVTDIKRRNIPKD